MSVYESYIRDRHQEAAEARGEAEGRLIHHLDESAPIPEVVAAVARARAVAACWPTVIIAIDQGADLVDARSSALHVLTDQAIPRAGCPFTQGFAVAQIEAARFYCSGTAHLDAITTPATGRRASW